MMKIITKLRSDNKMLENVNEKYLDKIAQLEEKLHGVKNGELATKETELDTTKQALTKAEHVIKKLQAELVNQRRSVNFNEHEVS